MGRHVTLKKCFFRVRAESVVFVIFLPTLVSDQQHLHGQQVDENHALVLLTGAMTVMERV